MSKLLPFQSTSGKEPVYLSNMLTRKSTSRKEMHVMEHMDEEARMALKRRLERVLSEILSDKYDRNITITFKSESERPNH